MTGEVLDPFHVWQLEVLAAWLCANYLNNDNKYSKVTRCICCILCLLCHMKHNTTSEKMNAVHAAVHAGLKRAQEFVGFLKLTSIHRSRSVNRRQIKK